MQVISCAASLSPSIPLGKSESGLSVLSQLGQAVATSLDAAKFEDLGHGSFGDFLVRAAESCDDGHGLMMQQVGASVG